MYSQNFPQQILSANQQHIKETKYLEQVRKEKIMLGYLVRTVMNKDY